MAVCLLKKEPETNYCEFSYDNWAEDEKDIPTMNTPGHGNLRTILSCCHG